MLELFDQNPQSRVFHVDRECYIVYLGAHWEDYRPFLRIGTSTRLPDTLPRIVSTIVVPDSLTGNPLDETACLAGDATPETHYVGDLETVEHMKQFVGQETIPVEAIEAIDHEEDDGKHVLVYYYKDGNLRIKYRKNEVFDLRRREKLDAHFVARAQEAKNEYGRSPFKLPGDSYQRPGFVVVDGSPFLVARGELAALRLTDDYFTALCAAGVDADRVSVVQAEDADRALIRFFKRSRMRDRTVRVTTPRHDRVQQATELFPDNSLPALKAKISDGHGGSFEFHRFKVTEAPGRFEAVLDDLDGPVVFGSVAKKQTDAAVVVDSTAGSLAFPKAGATHPLLEGAVYQIAPDTLTRTAIEERFIPEKNYPYRDALTQAENTLLGQLQYFFNELFAGRDTGKVLRTIRSLEPIKAIGKEPTGIHPVVQVVLHNYRQYLAFIRAHESEAARGAESLASLLDKHRVTRADIPPMLPLVAEIHRDGDNVYLFYRLAARVTSDRFAHAERVVENIAAEPIVDFEAERKRLEDLIAGLATPEQMDEARMRRIAEAKKTQQKKTTPAAADSKSDSATDGGEGAGADAPGDAGRTAGGGKAGRGTSDRAARSRDRATGSRSAKRSSNRRGGWVLPVAVVVLVLAALLALLLTGTIPNPWFGDETTIAGSDDQTGNTASVGTNDDQSASGDTTAGGETVGDAGTEDGQPADGTTPGDTGTGQAGEDGTSTTGLDGDAAADAQTSDNGDVQLPEGWPPDSLPAIRALEDTPGVTITRTRVIGPGGIEITLRDIIDLVNRVATDNGYATMSEVNPERPDPDWIYPGNVFVLPNSTRYTVVQGDTLWEITVRYMVARLRQDYERFTELVSEYESSDTSDARKGQIARTLSEIGTASHTENFSRLVDETLDRWGE